MKTLGTWYNIDREVGIYFDAGADKMKEKNCTARHNRKRVCYILALLVFGIALFFGTESVMKEESTHVYQVFCIGDSITYGSGLPKEERNSECYPAQLQTLLGAHYQVINYGMSGRTLMDNTERSYRDTGYIDMVKIQSPDILLVMLGTNDSKQEVWDASRYRQEYIALVQELQEIASRPDIYLMIPPKAYPYDGDTIVYGINNDIIRDEIRGIIADVSSVTGTGLIDLYAVTENHPEYFMDGVHPNQKGYEVLAAEICRQIEKN